MTRVFLLDDHGVVRRGVREFIEAEDDLKVVREASNSAEALTRIPVAHPDAAILDVRLSDGDGIEVCREIRSENPEVACLMLTPLADDEALLGAHVAGASGYVLKQIRESDLDGSIRRAATGESLLDPHLMALAKARPERDEEDERSGRLSPPERRTLDLIAEGKTNREIALAKRSDAVIAVSFERDDGPDACTQERSLQRSAEPHRAIKSRTIDRHDHRKRSD